MPGRFLRIFELGTVGMNVAHAGYYAKSRYAHSRCLADDELIPNISRPSMRRQQRQRGNGSPRAMPHSVAMPSTLVWRRAAAGRAASPTASS